MLRQLGSEYVSPIDTGALMTYLTQNLGQAVAPQFLPPDKMIDVQFSVRGNDFSYGNDLDGVITITNKGAEPLVITPEGLFQGNLRVSAQVGGDHQEGDPGPAVRDGPHGSDRASGQKPRPHGQAVHRGASPDA